jgi:uncharacterized protein (DUF1330 family)
MAAYLIGQVIVKDENRFAPYVQQTSALIERYGGEVLDVVRAVEVVEGSWPIGALTALVRFPDEEALRAFWDSPENDAMKDLRHSSATSHVALCLSIEQDGNDDVLVEWI